MATFTSKFNTGDTAYLVNETTGELTKFVITEIFLRQSIATDNSVHITYRVRRMDGNYPALNRDYDETGLYTTDEAKEKSSQILVMRQAALQNLG